NRYHMEDIKKRCGFRVGSGRKKGEPSTVVRVPDGILAEVQRLIEAYKSNPEPFKAPKSNPEPFKAPKSNPEPFKAPKSNPEPFRTASDGIDPATNNPFFDWDAKAMSSQKRAKARALRKKKNKKR
ncbi:hypothetical protein, partial [Vibrio parahaemolyticus]|uniref:hypothetical protein n=1 Tax=Vibrio parahaemolyticus TaxID=670 RepID=UPI003AAFEC0C